MKISESLRTKIMESMKKGEFTRKRAEEDGILDEILAIPDLPKEVTEYNDFYVFYKEIMGNAAEYEIINKLRYTIADNLAKGKISKLRPYLQEDAFYETFASKTKGNKKTIDCAQEFRTKLFKGITGSARLMVCLNYLNRNILRLSIEEGYEFYRQRLEAQAILRECNLDILNCSDIFRIYHYSLLPEERNDILYKINESHFIDRRKYKHGKNK